MRLAPLLLLVVAVQARAQTPNAAEVVAAWQSGWDRAYAGQTLEADERSVRTVEGPRGDLRVEAEGTVAYAADRPPARTAERLRVGGRELRPGAGARYGRRVGRAFGPAGRLAAAPAPLPDRVLAGARASDLTPTALDATPAWRVSLAGDRGQGQAWFTRDARAPRLLALRTEAGVGDGRVVREVRYVRVDGLDLPAGVRAQATVRQRRRLRDYVVTLAVVADYSGHRAR